MGKIWSFLQKYDLEKVILKIGYFFASSMTTTLRRKQPQRKRTVMEFTLLDIFFLLLLSLYRGRQKLNLNLNQIVQWIAQLNQKTERDIKTRLAVLTTNLQN